jgi:lipoprotein-anchoring transpeptidase ErfK/SrfK
MTTRMSIAACGLALLAACSDAPQPGEPVANSKVVPADSGGTTAPTAPPTALEPNMLAKADGPELGVVQFMVSIYEKPDRRSKKLGYLRVGERVPRGEKPAAFDGCQGGFYNILPDGYVCTDDGATIDMDHSLMRAKLKTADHTKPLPYDYGFIRGIAPRYYRLPSTKEQFQYEMSLKKHLRSYGRLKEKWNAHDVGSNDVRIMEDGVVLGPPPEDPPVLDTFAKFGGDGTGNVPWFFDGSRQIPNISSFKVPDYAIITNRIKRHAGVALIDAFAGDEREFALTTDLRLIPISKLKPGRGSTFHGVELTEGWELPVGFIKKAKGAYDYKKQKGRYKRRRKKMAYGMPIQLTGEVRKDGKNRYVETEDGTWIRTRDLAVAPKVSKLPRHAKKEGQKWIDVSIQRQTLILYQGTEPVYATMVSTGKDGLGDPRKTHSTPRGTFTIRDKHVTATMDSQVLGSEFELNDVPWVQYFKAGYALHAAYWHTEYGRARSHGCINLSPIDAYRIFGWTDPPLPSRWHSVTAAESTGKGTIVHVHP